MSRKRKNVQRGENSAHSARNRTTLLPCVGIRAEANTMCIWWKTCMIVSEDDNYVLTLEERETIHIVKAMQYTKRISAHMVLNDTLVKFELDCGVKVNILPLDIHQEVFDDHQCNHLEKTEIHRETSPGSGQ